MPSSFESLLMAPSTVNPDMLTFPGVAGAIAIRPLIAVPAVGAPLMIDLPTPAPTRLTGLLTVIGASAVAGPYVPGPTLIVAPFAAAASAALMLVYAHPEGHTSYVAALAR